MEPDTSLLQLNAGALRAEIAPVVGGSLTRFEGTWSDAEGRQGRVDWLRPASEEGVARRNPLAMASFPLVPFCNRIRNGRASFEGREIRFPPNHPAEPSPHPLHGIGWQRPWTVLAAGERHAALGLEVSATDAWPWRFSARQDYELDEHRLRVTIAINNLDSATMPAGIGHHPYFPHTRGTRVTARTSGMWQADDEVMPLALAVTPAVAQLARGIELSTLDLDNNFVGWDRHARIEWLADLAGPRRSVLMAADAPLDYFVLYCPPGYDHFCAEPVSQCTDWLNLLPAYGHPALGGARVAPGRTLQASFTLAPSWY